MKRVANTKCRKNIKTPGFILNYNDKQCRRVTRIIAITNIVFFTNT